MRRINFKQRYLKINKYQEILLQISNYYNCTNCTYISCSSIANTADVSELIFFQNLMHK